MNATAFQLFVLLYFVDGTKNNIAMHVYCSVSDRNSQMTARSNNCYSNSMLFLSFLTIPKMTVNMF